ncbi:uncharacterized protein TOT_040000048 [Theileria orientalis strain Shintoku]|uniref:Amidase domain-containing protein n=1 Tax=Theileria orientalis strain Shintoku TaxID=869250 RepID=J4CDS8_THEOR|nr:uncharacterized protein TOT_040000048 [Theileria orientalis strain Shintoku]PVC53716.1 hypothetical protein MACL_00003586 [Theileria orientalis]BAM41667.1 uncharacterized protein TOT_040000048 [Theileria orientalis strain Shintoku]|eukprot:XP_009691968.1 uncharacterized protein TOT_040000048 [Theileria orientalis strain Shintoku]
MIKCNGIVKYPEIKKEYSKSQIQKYVKEFLNHSNKYEGKATHEAWRETSGWKYIVKCLESVQNGGKEKVDEKELNKYEAYCYVLNKYEIFEQVVRIVERVRRGEGEKMKLFGLPVALKDNLTLKEVPFSNGVTKGPYKSSYTATSVKGLLEQGIIVVGKTKLNGFGVGSNTTEVINPLGEEYIVGGSSGGSAVAVSGNAVTCAVGTDTGGSVRCPAAFASAVGYRPSYGVISRYGMSELCGSFDTVGYITNNVEQALIMAAATIGHDRKDMNSRPEADELKRKVGELVERTSTSKRIMNGWKSLEKLKIGMFDAEEIYKLGYIDEENKKNMENVEKITKKLGAEVVKVEALKLRECTALYYLKTAKNVATNIRRFKNHPYQKKHQELEEFLLNLDPRITERFLLGEYVKEVSYEVEKLFEDKKRELVKWVEKNKMFKEVEFLITPTTSEVLPLKNEDYQSKNMYMLDIFETVAPILGVCSMSLPLRNGTRPNAFQITGGYLQDHKLFEISRIYEDNMNK